MTERGTGCLGAWPAWEEGWGLRRPRPDALEGLGVPLVLNAQGLSPGEIDVAQQEAQDRARRPPKDPFGVVRPSQAGAEGSPCCFDDDRLFSRPDLDADRRSVRGGVLEMKAKGHFQPVTAELVNQEAFDWEMVSQMPGYAMAHPGGEGGINGGIGETHDGKGRVTFYIEVSDIQGSLAAVERLGGKAVFGPEEEPNGPTIALFADPEGHLVGLVKARA